MKFFLSVTIVLLLSPSLSFGGNPGSGVGCYIPSDYPATFYDSYQNDYFVSENYFIAAYNSSSKYLINNSDWPNGYVCNQINTFHPYNELVSNTGKECRVYRPSGDVTGSLYYYKVNNPDKCSPPINNTPLDDYFTIIAFMFGSVGFVVMKKANWMVTN